MYCFAAPTTDVYRNLATEEYLLKHHSENIFMLWQSDHAVVIGKNQNVDAEVNTDYTSNRHISIARRYSGGGAVYQDMGNINLTFIETTGQITFNRYINKVLAFLKFAGIEAQSDERLGITINGLKISGSAQCVYKQRVMYHCTLLYSSDLHQLNSSLNNQTAKTELLSGAPHIRAVSSVHSEVTNLCDYLPEKLSVKSFKELIQNYFLNENPANNGIYHLSIEDAHAVEELRERKYKQKKWIYERLAMERQVNSM